MHVKGCTVLKTSKLNLQVVGPDKKVAIHNKIDKLRYIMRLISCDI